MDVRLLILLSVAGVISAAVKTMTGFGFAVVFQIVWQIPLMLGSMYALDIHSLEEGPNNVWMWVCSSRRRWTASSGVHCHSDRADDIPGFSLDVSQRSCQQLSLDNILGDPGAGAHPSGNFYFSAGNGEN